MSTADISRVGDDEKAAVYQHENTLQPVETEGDVEAPIARGVDLEAIPEKYWWSWRFIGSAFSIILLAVSLYINFALPVSPLLSST